MNLTSTLNQLHTASRIGLACLALALLATGCGDGASGNGDMGHLTYTLHSDYYMTSDELRDVRIVTGFNQFMAISPTDAGSALLDEEEVLVHSLPSTASATLSNDESGLDANFVVQTPGAYELTSRRKNGELFDKITLQFEKPAALELLTWVRPPNAPEFSQVVGLTSSVVEEGTQATFLPVPLGADGVRLAGDIETEFSADDMMKFVIGENVEEVYENNLISYEGDLSIYFIETGFVTVWFHDTVYGSSGFHTFQVVPRTTL